MLWHLSRGFLAARRKFASDIQARLQTFREGQRLLFHRHKSTWTTLYCMHVLYPLEMVNSSWHTVPSQLVAWSRLLTSLHLSQQIKETVPTAALDVPHNTVHVRVNQRAAPCITKDRHLSSLVWVTRAHQVPLCCFLEAQLLTCGLFWQSQTFIDLAAADFSAASLESSLAPFYI